MALTKGLLLKGLAGLTVCGGAATGGTLFATGVIGGGDTGLPSSPNENQNERTDESATQQDQKDISSGGGGVNANGSRDTDPNLAPAKAVDSGSSDLGGGGTKEVPSDGSNTPGSQDEATIKDQPTEETSKVEGADTQTAKTTNGKEPGANDLTTNTDPNPAPAQTPSRDGAGGGTTDSNQDGTGQQTDNRDNTHQVTQTAESDTLEKQKGQEGSENPTNPSNSLSTSQGGSTDDQNKTQQGSQISGEPSSSPTTTEGGQVGDGQQVNQVQDDQHTGDNEGLPSPVPGGASGTQGDKPAVDNTGSTPPGSSGADGTPGSTSTNEPGTEGGNSADGGGGSELSDISTTDQASQSQTQEEKINAKLVELGLQNGKCNFVKDETTKTCSISKKELNQMKFEDSDDNSDEEEDDDSEEKDIQLKVEILTGNKKTDYGFNDSEDENNLLFTLSGIQSQIEVIHGDLTLYPNINLEFKIEDNKLKKLWGTHSDLTGKVGIKKEEKGSYKFESTQGENSLKYSSDSGENINTLNSPTTTGTISVSDNNSNYNLGIKVNFSATVTSSSGGSDSLEKGDYEIKYKDGDNGGWYLSKWKEPVNNGRNGTEGEQT